jgi:ribose transport system permease protein
MVLRMTSSEPGSERPYAQGASPARFSNPFRQGLIGTIFSRYATVVILVALMIAFSFLNPHFLTLLNLRNLLVVQVTACCLAFAAILTLIVGEFDLSLGYMIGFLMMAGALLGGFGFGAIVVIPTMIVGGALIGMLNGWLRVKFQISSFIATLGVGIALSGATQGLSGGNVQFSGIPPLVTAIGQDTLFGIGMSIWLTLIIAAFLVYILEHTPFGRQLYAIGGSERVAFLAGVRLNLYKVVAFAGAGFLVGIASIFELGQAGGANPLFGPELLLPAYAAAFLGVTTYRPGYFNVPGALIAIVLLAVGFNGLNLLGAPYWLQPIFNGAVLVIAVIVAKAEGRQIMK